MLLDKMKSFNSDKKEIFYNHLDKNLSFIQKNYVEKLIVGGNYYLNDFNWNLNVIISAKSNLLSYFNRFVYQLLDLVA